MKRHLLITALMAAVLCSPARGQIVTLYGRAVDAANGESLFYASVALDGKPVTNVANSKGVFSFKIPSEEADAKIVVSHQGYAPRTVAASEFAGHTEKDPLEIRLIPVAIRLDPAMVTDINPEFLIESAYRRKADNYPTARAGLTSFYREIGKKGSSKYIFLNEAILDIDKSPYIGYSPDRIGVYKGRGTTLYDQTDTIVLKLQGGIMSTMDLDIVKNPFVGVPLEFASQCYEFELGGIVSHDGMLFYKVDFRPREGEEDILYRGSVYIETQSLAIGRADFSMALEGREKEAASKFVVKKASGVTYRANRADYSIRYRKFGDKWYYDYCRIDFQLAARRKRSIFATVFTVTEEMAVTDHKDGEFPIARESRVKFRDVLSDKVADWRDDAFWGEYNVIEPDQEIGVIIKRIVRQLDKREK